MLLKAKLEHLLLTVQLDANNTYVGRVRVRFSIQIVPIFVNSYARETFSDFTVYFGWRTENSLCTPEM